MAERLNSTAEIVSRLKKCTTGEASTQNTQPVIDGNFNCVLRSRHTIIKHPSAPSDYWYTKTQTRARSLRCELKGAAWDGDLEHFLCLVLTDCAKLTEVRTLEGIVGAVRHAAVVLSMFRGKARMNVVHVREKVIKMHALSYKFWTFVVNFQLPFDNETGKVTHGEWEVECFKVLATIAREMDVTTVDGLLSCIREASKQLNTSEDNIHRRVRTRRSPFVTLFLHLHTTCREVDLDTGKFTLVEADNMLVPEFLAEVTRYSAHGYPGFQHQRDFYILSKAAILLEEKYIYFSDDVAATRRYDVGGLLRGIPPHNSDEDIHELMISHSIVLAYARFLNLV